LSKDLDQAGRRCAAWPPLPLLLAGEHSPPGRLPACRRRQSARPRRRRKHGEGSCLGKPCRGTDLGGVSGSLGRPGPELARLQRTPSMSEAWRPLEYCSTYRHEGLVERRRRECHPVFSRALAGRLVRASYRRWQMRRLAIGQAVLRAANFPGFLAQVAEQGIDFVDETGPWGASSHLPAVLFFSAAPRISASQTFSRWTGNRRSVQGLSPRILSAHTYEGRAFRLCS